MKNYIKKNSALIVLLVVTIILRFWNYVDVPYTHDEFSALFRTHFNSFSDLIQFGVRPDAHPAAVQVLIYYWGKLFGYSSVAVKLPFTLMGVFSVYLTYLIGKKWFNVTVGLVTAATISAMQYTVMYSQIARPYISGLFFSLLLVYALILLIENEKKNFLLKAFFFIASFSLCTYNHYFSFLFAVIVGFSCIFLVPIKSFWKYLVFALIIFLLYVPYLSIFFFQLGKGGVGGPEGWLHKPHPTFIVDYLLYLFNFSAIFIVIVFGIITWTIWSGSAQKIDLKKYLLCTSWFLLPLLIGYFYSTYFSAVLQFSVLIFSFVYFIFLLYGHIKECKPKVNFLLVCIILAGGAFSLVFQRDFYTDFYQSPYTSILNDAVKYRNSKIPVLVQSDKKIIRYYCEEQGIDSNFVWVDRFTKPSQLKEFIKKKAVNHDLFFLGCMSNINPIVIPIIQMYYPHIKKQANFWGGNTYLFSKKNNEEKIISELVFNDSLSAYWKIDSLQSLKRLDTHTNKLYYQQKQGEEWGPTFSMPLDMIVTNKNNFIDVFVKCRTDLASYGDAQIVTSLTCQGKNIFWSSYKLSDFVDSTMNIKQWHTFAASIKLSDIYLNCNDVKFTTLLWNKSKKAIDISDFTIRLREGNPILYGIINAY